jgi:hypothetical protein
MPNARWLRGVLNAERGQAVARESVRQHAMPNARPRLHRLVPTFAAQSYARESERPQVA